MSWSCLVAVVIIAEEVAAEEVAAEVIVTKIANVVEVLGNAGG